MADDRVGLSVTWLPGADSVLRGLFGRAAVEGQLLLVDQLHSIGALPVPGARRWASTWRIRIR